MDQLGGEQIKGRSSCGTRTTCPRSAWTWKPPQCGPIAVGTLIAERPPHKTERARFRLPPWVS